MSGSEDLDSVDRTRNMYMCTRSLSRPLCAFAPSSARSASLRLNSVHSNSDVATRRAWHRLSVPDAISSALLSVRHSARRDDVPCALWPSRSGESGAKRKRPRYLSLIDAPRCNESFSRYDTPLWGFCRVFVIRNHLIILIWLAFRVPREWRLRNRKNSFVLVNLIDL